MTTLREAAQQALEALENGNRTWEAMRVISAALEQPEQCACGDRPKENCPGEWEPGCDLGNNPKYARRVPLEQPEQEQEPVAWMCADEDLVRKGYSRFSRTKDGAWSIPVYTHPPRREWLGLTEEEIVDIWAAVSEDYNDEINIIELGRAIEQALKEKNYE
jgi:hypothetical protein